MFHSLLESLFQLTSSVILDRLKLALLKNGIWKLACLLLLGYASTGLHCSLQRPLAQDPCSGPWEAQCLSDSAGDHGWVGGEEAALSESARWASTSCSVITWEDHAPSSWAGEGGTPHHSPPRPCRLPEHPVLASPHAQLQCLFKPDDHWGPKPLQVSTGCGGKEFCFLGILSEI